MIVNIVNELHFSHYTTMSSIHSTLDQRKERVELEGGEFVIKGYKPRSTVKKKVLIITRKGEESKVIWQVT